MLQWEGSGSRRWPLYQYLVTADDFDGDGISIGADALNLPAGVRMYAFHDRENAELALGSYAVTDDAAHTVRDTMPSFGAIQPQHYRAGAAVDFTLPNSDGGDGVIAYTLAPATLPEGLSYTCLLYTSPSPRD